MNRSPKKAKTSVIVTSGDKLPDWHKFFSEWAGWVPIGCYPRQKLYCHHWHYFVLDWHNRYHPTIIISGNITVVVVVIRRLPIAGNLHKAATAASLGHKVARSNNSKLKHHRFQLCYSLAADY